METDFRESFKAILVGITDPMTKGKLDSDWSEFQGLVTAIEGNIMESITCNKERIHPRYLVGKGKLEEIKIALESTGSEVVIFNCALTPLQERNLGQHLGCAILDRTQLILSIFGKRAKSFEGKLQVELAKLEHLATRLVRGWTHLERQRGGIGLRSGPGETQLEADRRVLRHRIDSLKKRLEKLKNQRIQNRKARRRSGIPTITLVGYTNAGKSTLFNELVSRVNSQAVVKDMLFTTLDPLLRKIYLRDFGQVIVADTVGFISNLPHELIEAFKATLEEAVETDLLLHVIDASDSHRNSKIKIVNSVLQEIGSTKVPQLEVLNKIDLLDNFESRIDWDEHGMPQKVWLSAFNRAGIEYLVDAIVKFLAP